MIKRQRFFVGLTVLASLSGSLFFQLDINPALAMMRNSGSGITTRHMRAPQPRHSPAYFLAWKGDKLITTVGSFVIDKSVTVIDKAGSRYLGPTFKGTPPIVHFSFKNGSLVGVTIE